MMLEILDIMLEPVFSAFSMAEASINTAAPAGILLLGLLTGLRHSIEADHVAAVSTMVASDRKSLRQALVLGTMWGIGHSATLFAAGLLVLLLAMHISESTSSRLEFGVGVMLIFLGATTFTGFKVGRFLRGLYRKHGHSHPHVHPEHGIIHTHDHDHEASHYHSHKSIIVGMIHGMAGSGALMLAVLSTIQSVPLGLAYIAIFGAGSIASMAGVSTLIGLPFTKMRNFAKVTLALRYASAIVAIAIGAGLIYDLGFVEQVFSQ